MKTVENTVQTTAIFNEEGTERYLLRKILTPEADTKRACIITIYPASTDALLMDLTSCLIQNSIYLLGFTSYDALNISPKINPSSGRLSDISPENMEQIKKSSKETTEKEGGIIIIAWGSAGASNKKICKAQHEILRLLQPFSDKVYMITDGKNKNLHPLVPSLRGSSNGSSSWILEKFSFPELKAEDTEKQDAKKKKKGDKKEIQTQEVKQEPDEQGEGQKDEPEKEPEEGHEEELEEK
jgi:hypothetical protein